MRQVGGSLGTAMSMTIVSWGSLYALENGSSSKLATTTGYHWAFYFLIFIALLGIIFSLKLLSITTVKE